MVSLGGSERIAEEYLIKIFEALFCAITILQNNRYYGHIASPWRSRFVRLKMPVTGEDYDETDCRNVLQRFLPAA